MTIAFVMPVFNEQETIRSFISEIFDVFQEFEKQIYIVDDYSSDKTRDKVREEIEFRSNSVFMIENSINLGHGPSTIVGWGVALANNSDTVICFDGDGEFNLEDLRTGLKNHLRVGADLSEGIRINRFDPAYRSFITSTLKLLVFAKTHYRLPDPNTPIRIYKRTCLEQILSTIEARSMIPNVYVGIIARKLQLKVIDFETDSRQRKNSSVGTTWNPTFSGIPSKKFLKFIVAAFWELKRFLSNPR